MCFYCELLEISGTCSPPWCHPKIEANYRVTLLPLMIAATASPLYTTTYLDWIQSNCPQQQPPCWCVYIPGKSENFCFATTDSLAETSQELFLGNCRPKQMCFKFPNSLTKDKVISGKQSV